MQRDRLFGLVLVKKDTFDEYGFLTYRENKKILFGKSEYGLTTRLALAYIAGDCLEDIPTEVQEFAKENGFEIKEMEIIYKLINK